MIVVTAGKNYLDIDAYGGCIAYAELLRLKGLSAVAASTARPNSSVPQMLLELKVHLQNGHQTAPDDEFVIIDMSDPDYFDEFVKPMQVAKIFDHHPGFEDFWHDKIGNSAKIEHIGAACTLVFEEWEKSGLLPKISQESALLLACGILDNTLNFGAKISTKRDNYAYKTLAKVAKLPKDVPHKYFADCQKTIANDIESTLKNDTKNMKITIGQIAVWNADEIIGGCKEQIAKTLAQISPDWYANIIAIKDGKSHFLCTNGELQKYLAKLLNVKFINNVATADRMWLRKEIFKEEIVRGMEYNLHKSN